MQMYGLSFTYWFKQHKKPEDEGATTLRNIRTIHKPTRQKVPKHTKFPASWLWKQ